mmetsp:Transcript_31968/g.90769  ORF Transcript_31968/g.90769 Transcript_31968/m.90769 type:complete len:207 (-) Transcript_31968:1830-2450(-)
MGPLGDLLFAAKGGGAASSNVLCHSLLQKRCLLWQENHAAAVQLQVPEEGLHAVCLCCQGRAAATSRRCLAENLSSLLARALQLCHGAGGKPPLRSIARRLALLRPPCWQPLLLRCCGQKGLYGLQQLPCSLLPAPCGRLGLRRLLWPGLPARSSQQRQEPGCADLPQLWGQGGTAWRCHGDVHLGPAQWDRHLLLLGGLQESMGG